MADQYDVELDQSMAETASNNLTNAAQALEDAITTAQQRMANVEGRSSATFIQDFKRVFDEFSRNNVGQSIAELKAQAAQIKQSSDIMAKEANTRIDV